MAPPPDHNPPLPPSLFPAVLGANRARQDVPTIDMTSVGPLPDLPELPDARMSRRVGELAAEAGADREPGPASESMFWLTGDVLMCACPECGAPMAVRLWLMIADCWRCETCIELTEEQEREARRLLERHHLHASVPSAAATPAQTQHLRQPVAAALDKTVPSADDPARLTDGREPSVSHEPAAPPRLPRAATRRRVRRTRPANRLAHWLHALLKNMPAWLISLLFHVILLTILGLLTSDEAEGPYITLSSRVNRVVREGGDVRIVDPTDDAVFDLGVPDAIDMQDPVMRRAMVRANQDAANCG